MATMAAALAATRTGGPASTMPAPMLAQARIRATSGDSRRARRSPRSAVSRAPIGIGQDLGPERAERDRQQDEQKVAELPAGRKGSSKGPVDRRESSGDSELQAARRDGRPGERPASGPGPQEVRGGRKEGGTTEQLQHNCGRRIRGQRDTRRGEPFGQED